MLAADLWQGGSLSFGKDIRVFRVFAVGDYILILGCMSYFPRQ